MSPIAGRSSRGTFIAVQVLLLLATIAFLAWHWPLDFAAFSPGFLLGLMVWLVIFSLIYLIYTVRRLHDVGRTGAWSLAHLVPFAGIALEIYLTIAPGERKANRYGLPPKSKPVEALDDREG